MKKIAALALGVAMMITPAMAGVNQFYKGTSGQWAIEGYYGDKDFCSAKTYFPDGSYVSMFVMAGEKKANLWVHNKSWNLDGDYGHTYSGSVSFRGAAGGEDMRGDFELKDNNTIIFRNLTDEFLENWVNYRELRIYMPNGIPDFTMGLVGTRDSVDLFVECLEILNGENE